MSKIVKVGGTQMDLLSLGKPKNINSISKNSMFKHYPSEQENIQRNFRTNSLNLRNSPRDFASEEKIEKLCEKKDISLELKMNLKEYILDIEQQTGREIKEKQVNKIEKYLVNAVVTKLAREKSKAHRVEFNQMKSELRGLWEMETGQKWPTYDKDVIVKGKIVRRKNQSYDAHHIIECSFGGPNRWWNLHPAAYPDQHQDGIHRDEGYASKIFGKLSPNLHVVKRSDKIV